MTFIVWTILLVSTLVSLTGCGQQKVDYREYFDIKGNVKEIEVLNSLDADSGEVSYREIWTFNEDGQLLKRESFSFDNIEYQRKPIELIIYSYEGGLLKFEETLDSAGNTDIKYEITKHNDKGFPLEYKLIEGENAINKIVYSFTKDSKEALSFDNDLPIDRYTTFYDNKQNVIAEKLEWLYVPDTTVTYNRTINNLTLDNQGNWTKRTIKEIESRRSRTEERKINYH